MFLLHEHKPVPPFLVNQSSGELVVAYNSKYFRTFGRRGEHLGGERFPVELSEVAALRFFADVATFASVHWSGEQVRDSTICKGMFGEFRTAQDADDPRLWVRSSGRGKASEAVLAHHCALLSSLDDG